MSRIYLSPPDVGEAERTMLLDAFDSNWIAPLGPHVDGFEKELAERVGVAGAVALSSGTAALHLALLLVGVKPGDDVLVPTFTFVATANVATYIGARPVLVDCDRSTWQIDTTLVAEELQRRARRNELPGAVVTVDLYGQTADYDTLVSLCEEYGVPLVEDAAEALGATNGDARGGIVRNGGRVLVQREQDHHHERRRDVGVAVRRARRKGTPSRHPSPRARGAL